MQNFFSIILFCFLLSLQASAGDFYNQLIYAQNSEQKEYNEALSDFSAYLQKISGKYFTVAKTSILPAKGIVVLLNQKGLLNASLSKKLEEATGESFVLSGNSDRLLIIANHPSGLAKGIYSYLDWLGVKWYFPGENWQVVPQKSSIIYIGSNFQSPSFSVRNFFGTGGIRSVTSIDADGKLTKEWDNWKRRNRMGGNFNIGGHYGEVFNLNHQKELLQHPEYLALVKGKREWDASAKWCLSNAGFRKFFIEDRVAELKTDLLSKTYPYSQVVLSVDPSDGGGDCECDYCKKLGTVSERYYFLANETAKAFSKVSSKASVSLLAYNTHVAPPSFALEPNVVVMVVPYAFQNFGTPQQLMDAWAGRHRNLLVYDYYCIPDWNYEVPMPRKTSPDSLVNRLRYWLRKGSKGFLLESAFGTALAGEGLYLAARLGWNAETDVVKTRQEFLNAMFGTASNEAASFLGYLQQDFMDASSLPYLRAILASAKAKAGSEAQTRISEFEAYLHYLTLYFKWQSATENTNKSWEELVEFVWEVYPLKIVHSTRIADLLFYQLKEGDDRLENWNILPPYGKKLNKIRFIDKKRITGQTVQDMKDDPILDGFKYKQVERSTIKLNLVKSGFTVPERKILGVNFPKTFLMSSGSGSIGFSIRMEDDDLKYSAVVVKLVDTSSGAIVFSKRLEVNNKRRDISVSLRKNSIYQLVLEYRPWLRLSVPADQWIAFAEIPFYSVMDTLWFHVPSNTGYIYYSNTEKEQPIFTSNEGKMVQPEKVNEKNMYRLKVNSKTGWWSISLSQYKNLKFYSLPDLFFPHAGYAVGEK
jgi:hypothetical protein